jgi:hypothetical protein
MREYRLKGLSDAHQAVIDTLQPYRTVGFSNEIEALAGLRDLGRLPRSTAAASAGRPSGPSRSAAERSAEAR